jgi:putative PIN family toxin of toxin-antitoxin system
LWSIERRLQLIVSPPVIDEYFETLERVTDEPHLITLFRQRLQHSPTVTRVNLGRRFAVSRDPDDDILLATAHTGRARYLVTNDRDLLEIPAAERRGFRFEIVKPAQLLRLLER